MGDLLGALLLALMFGGPIVGYHLGARDPRRTRMQIVTGATLGGASVALLIAIGTLRMPAESRLSALPYAIYAIGLGATIGIAGLLARAFGAWLSRRP